MTADAAVVVVWTRSAVARLEIERIADDLTALEITHGWSPCLDERWHELERLARSFGVPLTRDLPPLHMHVGPEPEPRAVATVQ